MANHIFNTRYQIDLLDYMLTCNQALREGCDLPEPPNKEYRRGADGGISVDAIWSQLYGQMYRISDHAHYARIGSNDEDIANQAQRMLDRIHQSADPTDMAVPIVPRLVQIGMDTRTYCRILIRPVDKPVLPDPTAPRQFFQNLMPLGAKWERALIDVQFTSKPTPTGDVHNGYCTVHDRAAEIHQRMAEVVASCDATIRQVKPFDFDGLNFQLTFSEIHANG